MKKLMRSRNGKLGGVCAGFANKFSNDEFTADPTWIRLGWVLITLLSFGLGFLAYLVCWVIIPIEPKYVPTPQEPSTK